MPEVSQSAINAMVSFGNNFPLLWDFLLLLAAFTGFMISGFTLIGLAYKYVYLRPGYVEHPVGHYIIALLVGGALVSFSSTMFLFGNSLLDSGGGALFPPSVVNGSEPAHLIAKAVMVNLLRFIGAVLAFIGVVQLYLANKPEGDPQGNWSGLIRMACGAIIARVDVWFPDPNNYLILFNSPA